jgi:hypothetical protein
LKDHYDFGGIDITGNDQTEMDNMFRLSWGKPRLVAEQDGINEPTPVIPEGHTVIDKIPDSVPSIPVQPRKSLRDRWWDYWSKNCDIVFPIMAGVAVGTAIIVISIALCRSFS